MIETLMTSAPTVAVAATLSLAFAIVEIARLNRKVHGLNDRNAAQAVTIAGLNKRLSERVSVPPSPPRGEWPPMRGDAFPSREVDGTET